MESDDAILAFSALAQPTRLAVFRLLMTHEPEGLPAGDVARQLEVPHNTMSTHLGILSRAGLIRASRHSRSIVYRAQAGGGGRPRELPRQGLLPRPARHLRAADRRTHPLLHPRNHGGRQS